MDIGSYIIASLGLKTPNSNAEVITILNEAGYISIDKVETYIKMTGFRNRVVRLYNNIDVETLYDILANELVSIGFTALLTFFRPASSFTNSAAAFANELRNIQSPL